jgi:UPF0716 protein FxsA
LILFTVVPVIEVLIFFEMGEFMGVWSIVGMIILTGATGAKLASIEGLHVFDRIKEELDQGHLPGQQLVEAALILAGGLLLLTPGFFTDIAGIGLLLPPGRRRLGRYLIEHFKARLEPGAPWIEQR